MKPDTTVFCCLCAEMAEEEVYPNCEDFLLKEGDCRDEDIVETNSELELSDARETEVCVHYVNDLF